MKNIENIEKYKGREQTYVKHTLLRAYLLRLFMIIGQQESKIRYVDCFSGPWQEGSDDLEDTSISISLKIMKDCHEYFLKSGKHVEFEALYVEKDKTAFNKLESFLGKTVFPGIKSQAINGDFYSLREEILRWCKPQDFTFFFIDPTGWKAVIEPETLKPLLQRPRSEFLINFMFDFLLRTHPQKSFEREMIDIFGETLDTVGMNSKEKEIYLVNLYLGTLKHSLPYSVNKPRLAYAKILDPLKDRTKYNLVYLTRHPLGIIVFMEESEKLDVFQNKVRAEVKQKQKIEKSHQDELFHSDINVGESHIDMEEIKRYWLRKLSQKPKRFGVEELADMLEETRWFPGHFQKAFSELLVEKKVINLDAKRKRPVKSVHFDKNERLRKI